MSKDEKTIKWGDRDLSTIDAIMHYRGRCYVRPLGRGVVLTDLDSEPHLDDVLDSGDYEIEIRVLCRLPAQEK